MLKKIITNSALYKWWIKRDTAVAARFGYFPSNVAAIPKRPFVSFEWRSVAGGTCMNGILEDGRLSYVEMFPSKADGIHHYTFRNKNGDVYVADDKRTMRRVGASQEENANSDAIRAEYEKARKAFHQLCADKRTKSVDIEPCTNPIRSFPDGSRWYRIMYGPSY